MRSAPQVDGKFMSAFIRAVKPAGAMASATNERAAASCSGPTCCR